MKDKQEHHQQQDPTTTSQQAAFYSLSFTYSPLSFEALWNFNVTLSVANGKCRILHNDLDIPYIYTHTPDMDNLEKSIHYDFFCFLYSFFPLVVLIIFRELKFGRKKSSSTYLHTFQNTPTNP